MSTSSMAYTVSESSDFTNTAEYLSNLRQDSAFLIQKTWKRHHQRRLSVATARIQELEEALSEFVKTDIVRQFQELQSELKDQNDKLKERTFQMNESYKVSYDPSPLLFVEQVHSISIVSDSNNQQNLSTALKTSELEIKRLSELLTLAKNEKATLLKSMDDLRAKFQNVTVSLRGTQSQVRSLKMKYRDALSFQELYYKLKAQMMADQKHYEHTLAELKETHWNTLQELGSFREKDQSIEPLQKESWQFRTKCASLEDKLRTAQNENANLKTNLDEKRKECSKARRKVDDFQAANHKLMLSNRKLLRDCMTSETALRRSRSQSQTATLRNTMSISSSWGSDGSTSTILTTNNNSGDDSMIDRECQTLELPLSAISMSSQVVTEPIFHNKQDDGAVLKSTIASSYNVMVRSRDVVHESHLMEEDLKRLRTEDVRCNSIWHWSVHSVGQWLFHQLPVSLTHQSRISYIVDQFRNHGIDGKKVMSMNAVALDVIGVAKEDQQRVLKCIDKLRSEHTGSYSIEKHGHVVQSVHTVDREIQYENPMISALPTYAINTKKVHSVATTPHSERSETLSASDTASNMSVEVSSSDIGTICGGISTSIAGNEVKQLQDIQSKVKRLKRRRKLLIVSIQILQKQHKKCNQRQEYGKCKELMREVDHNKNELKQVNVQIARLKEDCAIKTRETIIDLQQRLVPSIASEGTVLLTDSMGFIDDQNDERALKDDNEMQSDIMSGSESFVLGTKQTKRGDSTTAFTSSLQRNERSPTSFTSGFTQMTVTEEFDAQWEGHMVNPFARKRDQNSKQRTANGQIDEDHRKSLFQRISKMKHLSSIAFSDGS